MNRIERLKQEHRDFSKLLDLLEAQIAVFGRGERPDYDLMLDILKYMTSYPDRFHHPREDVAFARLAQRNPAMRARVEKLGRQHRAIAESGARFLDNLNGALAGAMLKRETVEAPGRDYVALYREHMRMEERELFPLGAARLDGRDWAEIDAAIPIGTDPLFGGKVEERFRALHERIARAAQCDCVAA